MQLGRSGKGFCGFVASLVQLHKPKNAYQRQVLLHIFRLMETPLCSHVGGQRGVAVFGAACRLCAVINLEVGLQGHLPI